MKLEPLVPVMITRVEIGADMNPRHLLMTVRRTRCPEGQERSLALIIHQEDKDSIPDITIHETGEEVVWTLLMGTIARSVKVSADTAVEGCNTGEGSDMASAYKRSLQALSYKVQTALLKFPIVPAREMRVFGNTINRNIRDDTACTLLEWESLVQYATRRLNLPVKHEPQYHSRDVPRYDQPEMALVFPT